MTDKLTPGQLRDEADLIDRYMSQHLPMPQFLREEAARREVAAREASEWQTLVDPESGCPYRVPPEAPAPVDGLVARIRTAAPGRGTNFIGDLALEAADRIDSHDLDVRYYKGRIDHYRTRAEKAEAALRDMLAAFDDAGWTGTAKAACDIARAALSCASA